MKSAEHFVASIREFRFAVDRLSTDVQDEEITPATRQALLAQLKALQADIDRLLQELAAHEAQAAELAD